MQLNPIIIHKNSLGSGQLGVLEKKKDSSGEILQ